MCQISGYASDLLIVNILSAHPQEQIKLSQRFMRIIFAPFFGLEIDFNFRFGAFMLHMECKFCTVKSLYGLYATLPVVGSM